MEIRTIPAFIDYYQRIRSRTDKLVLLLPPDRLEWKYSPDKYSCGDIVRHIAAMERLMYLESIAANRSLYSGCGRDLADGIDEVMNYYNRLRGDSMRLLFQLRDEDLQKKCTTPGGIQITVWKWLRAMIEHEVHHRGQLYMYLGMFGIDTPPIFGLTAEEVQQQYKGPV
ncbi:MAG: DinB family protein [Sphingobacteriales bacterium]|nr:MAG: DinB family protein [Sphingobacteriales bacterium]